jgi:2-keto-3-deoxy-L-fuconate dehydrogenase
MTELPASPNAEFSGLVAVVTGGASGIGLATATELVRRGAAVAVLDLDPGELPTGLAGHTCDVTDSASVRAAVEAVEQHHGRLDVLVNNAGIGAQGTVEDNDETEWRRVLDVNVTGIARVSAAALPLLRRTAAGSPAGTAIVNTCSIAATAGLPQRALYSASKGAVLALTRAMAADHVHEGIRVNCVNPGTVDTPWVGRLLDAAPDPAAERTALNARQPTGRLVTAQEVAVAVCYLASPSAGATTGTALAVDGGMQGLRLRPATPQNPR